MDTVESRLLGPEELLTPAEAAEVLRSSTDYIWKLCREGHLCHMRKGRLILIRRQNLTDYIAGQIRGGVQQ